MANILPLEKRVQIVSCLVEGNSIRATSRMTGVCKEAIMRLLALLGNTCFEFQDKVLRNLTCKRIQCDEIWAFVGCKEQRLAPEQRGKGRGDCWTWTAIDPDTKLAVCWHVGLREAADGIIFMENLASRVAGRFQLSTDGNNGYRDCVENALGSRVDYGQVIKIFGRPSGEKATETRYSPARCKEVRYVAVKGEPAYEHICTSHNERNNLTMRMSMRRFTRLTNAFSKKRESHAHAVNLHMMHYNFCRIHQSIRVTPAMEAGLASHVWRIEEIVQLLGTDNQCAA